MRLHADNLNPQSLYIVMANLHKAGLISPDVYVDSATLYGSRKRACAIEFRLTATRGPGHWRRRNFSPDDDSAAATWAEHGFFFAALFNLDPKAIIGPYDGVYDFVLKVRAMTRPYGSPAWLKAHPTAFLDTLTSL